MVAVPTAFEKTTRDPIQNDFFSEFDCEHFFRFLQLSPTTEQETVLVESQEDIKVQKSGALAVCSHCRQWSPSHRRCLNLKLIMPFFRPPLGTFRLIEPGMEAPQFVLGAGSRQSQAILKP